MIINLPQKASNPPEASCSAVKQPPTASFSSACLGCLLVNCEINIISFHTINDDFLIKSSVSPALQVSDGG